MNDKKKTKDQLLDELAELRKKIAELEKAEKQYKPTKQSLNESEQKLRNIVEHSNELFYIHDIHHKLNYVSPQSLQILGYTPDEMITEWTNLITENPINKTGIETTEKALKTGKKQKPYILELYKKDGTKVLLEIDESPYKDKEGKVIGIIGAARDVTVQNQMGKALLESEEKFRILAETNSTSIIIFQRDKFLYINPATETLTGYTVEELLKMKLWDLIHPEFLEIVKKRELAHQRGEIVNPTYEFKIITKSGETRWVNTSGGLIKYNGMPAVIGTAFDITEKKIAEEALKKSERLYRNLADNALVGIYKTNLKGDILYINHALLRMLGYDSVEEITSIGALTTYKNPHNRKVLIERLKKTGRVRNFETELVTKTGTSKYVILNATLEDHIISGMIMDITDRRLAESALFESEMKFRTLAETNTAAIVIFQDSKFLYINPATETLTGYTKEELLEMNFWDAIDPDFQKLIKERELARQRGEKVSLINEFKIITKSGKTCWVSTTAGNIELEGKPAVIGTAFDITKRKLAEEALIESEEKYRTLVEHSLQGIIIAQGLPSRIAFTNSALADLLGYSVKELLSLSPEKTRGLIHPEDQALFFKRYQDRLEGKSVPSRYEIRAIRKDGSVRWLEIFSSRIEYNKNHAVQAAFIDITERKNAEEALTESEERYRTIFEDSREAIYVTTKNGKFIEVNQAALDLFDYTREEMLKLDAKKLYVNPDDRKIFQNEIEQKGSVRNYEIKFRKKDGTELICLVTSTVRKSIDGTITGYQGIIRDITEIRKVEDQLRHLSLHDPLTGLYNRAYFEEEMRRIESSRYNSVGIIMCDVDGLKFVNDALGHYNGDKMLLATATALRESFRESDVVARVGGDEFAILLPNSDSDSIKIAYQRIQDSIKNYNLSYPELPLSISIGSAISTRAPVIISNLFKEADNNMYREKLQNSLSARSTIVQTLMKALETRDFTSEGHINRLKELVTSLAAAIDLPERSLTDLRLLAEFHDIGKVGIPTDILFKPDVLTHEETIEMQRHCELGHRIALFTPDLIPIADLILKHHEWWNGEGYPFGIKSEAIPIECRILAICESYEAMTSDRPYHKPKPRNEALDEIKKSSGTKFDPYLVSKFIQVLESPYNDKNK